MLVYLAIVNGLADARYSRTFSETKSKPLVGKSERMGGAISDCDAFVSSRPTPSLGIECPVGSCELSQGFTKIHLI